MRNAIGALAAVNQGDRLSNFSLEADELQTELQTAKKVDKTKNARFNRAGPWMLFFSICQHR